MLNRLSILIVTYAGDTLLADCLTSIQSVCIEMPQVVVVDNSGSAETEQLVNRFVGVQYIGSKINLGFAGGNNRGLPFCKGDYVLLLNNDTLIREEPFTYLMRYLDEHPTVAVVQGKALLANSGGLLDGCGSFMTWTGLTIPNGFLVPDSSDYQKAFPVFYAGGMCLMFRRSIIEQVGGYLFYDHFKSYFEEVDFCHRVWICGSDVHFVPSPPIEHLHSQTANRFSRISILRQYYTNIWFSHLTCLDLYGRIRILPAFSVFFAGHAFMHLLLGHWKFFLAHIECLRSVWSLRKEVRAARKRIRSFRRRSEREVFRMVLKSPPLRYYWNAIVINIRNP
jgi:GT2 family glycosyltransferase